jgi:hypothetical protein
MGSQLDSDINVLPNYIMEIEDDAVQPPTDSSTQSDEDQWPGMLSTLIPRRTDC